MNKSNQKRHESFINFNKSEKGTTSNFNSVQSELSNSSNEQSESSEDVNKSAAADL